MGAESRPTEGAAVTACCQAKHFRKSVASKPNSATLVTRPSKEVVPATGPTSAKRSMQDREKARQRVGCGYRRGTARCHSSDYSVLNVHGTYIVLLEIKVKQYVLYLKSGYSQQDIAKNVVNLLENK